MKFSDPEKPCSGCAHSAAYAEFPGHPSGERPCGFCIRNPEGLADWFGEKGPLWYDIKTPPHTIPMDCYIATDRLQQQRVFDEQNRLAHSGKEAPERTKFPAGLGKNEEDIYCCEGGPAPGGHQWLCWGWLGIAFG
jgi:hypothetical protein